MKKQQDFCSCEICRNPAVFDGSSNTSCHLSVYKNFRFHSSCNKQHSVFSYCLLTIWNFSRF
ncbi:hypothetical protein DWW59_13400 [Firmicutes bacterium AF16-15]|nr:hypothetical protein DWW59_13400 [Firmicutes bacterium AF16-15]